MFILDDINWDGNLLVLVCYVLALAFGVVFIALMVLSGIFLTIDALIDCLPARWRNRNARADR
ncbi:MAG: hypothetical protein ACYCZR_05025 [Burkholderiales bacterium]